MPALRINHPNSNSTTHFLRGERITVGRGADNTIQIADRSVSSHHAEIFAVNGRFELHDLESTNLTLVEGEPVTTFDLREACRIAFGLVECEYDPAEEAPAPAPAAAPFLTSPAMANAVEPPAESVTLSAAELEKDVAFLRAENRELRGKVTFLESRLDMLGSARLVTSRTDSSPTTASAEALRTMKTERDESRHRSAALDLELANAREELIVARQERDAARHVAEVLQAKSQADQASSARAAAPSIGVAQNSASATLQAVGETAMDDPSATQRIFLPLPRGLERLLVPFRRFGAALEQALSNPVDRVARQEASEQAVVLVDQAAILEEHVFVRLARGVSDLLRVIADQEETPPHSTLRSLRQAGELLAKLLEPRPLEDGKTLPPPRILVIDDDPDLLASVEACLQMAHLHTTSCRSAEEAMNAISTESFDLLVVDVGLPGMDGTAFCSQARDLPAYRKTPILFLTIDDTLGRRAETSLSGGSDFIGKPFNVFELTLKVQTWAYRRQLGLH